MDGEEDRVLVRILHEEKNMMSLICAREGSARSACGKEAQRRC